MPEKEELQHTEDAMLLTDKDLATEGMVFIKGFLFRCKSCNQDAVLNQFKFCPSCGQKITINCRKVDMLNDGQDEQI